VGGRTGSVRARRGALTAVRVVSLLPAATEIVAWLGASDQLVGITHECDYPPGLASRPRVTSARIPSHVAPAPPGAGSAAAAIDAAVRAAGDAGQPLFRLDAATIAALHPDVILTQALCDVCAVSETDVRALAARLGGPPRIVTLGGTTIEGIFDDIRRVADALGVPDEADELLAGERARLRTVHDTLKAARAPRPRVLLVEWTDPCFLAGHWGPEQVRRAGGIDVLGVAGAHSVTRPIAECAAAAPEIVLVAPCGFDLDAARGEARRLMAHPDWQWLLGTQVWAMDANGLVSRPGPRVVDGVEAMAGVFNPTLFSPLDARHAERVA
jgi:iron complex transport system substrate-binding protein